VSAGAYMLMASGMGDPNVPITIINQPIAAASAAPDDACCCKYKKPVYR